jgi:hypothetical protein
MKRVNIKKILKDPKLKAELIKGVVKFLCQLEGHNHTKQDLTRGS